jgi:Phage integrase family
MRGWPTPISHGFIVIFRHSLSCKLNRISDLAGARAKGSINSAELRFHAGRTQTEAQAWCTCAGAVLPTLTEANTMKVPAAKLRPAKSASELLELLTKKALYHGETKAISAWISVRDIMNPQADTLFVSEQRRPISRAAVNLIVANVARAAGLSQLAIHPHMLRHSCGYWLANRGADSRLIQEFLGHARLENSARYMAVNRVRFARLF